MNQTKSIPMKKKFEQTIHELNGLADELKDKLKELEPDHDATKWIIRDLDKWCIANDFNYTKSDYIPIDVDYKCKKKDVDLRGELHYDIVANDDEDPERGEVISINIDDSEFEDINSGKLCLFDKDKILDAIEQHVSLSKTYKRC